MMIVAVPGTHAWREPGTQDWYSRGSPLMNDLAGHGIALLDATRPFVWSTGLGGVRFGAKLAIWTAAGLNLYAYLVPPRCPERRVPPADTIVLTHSHGLQVALCAAAEGLKIDTLVDVAGPVRHDLWCGHVAPNVWPSHPDAPVLCDCLAHQARRNIRRWVHVHAGPRDRWQWLGTLGDGHFGIVRAHPLADENVPVPQADHDDVLRDPRYFHIVREALTS